jgi:hypothetical protein
MSTLKVTNVRHGSSTSDTLVFGSDGRVTVLGAIGSISAVSSSSGTLTLDFATSNNFSTTLSENTTLANPSNITAGQSGVLYITQDSTPRTLAFGSYWDFEGGTAPTISTGSGAVDVLVWTARTTTNIAAQVLLNFS